MRRFYTLIPKTGIAQNHITRLKTMAPRMFSQSPAYAILRMGIAPVANTIAFGGVPMGIIKDSDAAKVAGNINKRGSIFKAKDKLAKRGSIRAANAVLLATSLKNATIKDILRIIMKGWVFCKYG